MSLLDDLRDKYNIVETPTEELDAETGLTLSEKARLVAQGASLGWSDEIIGAIKGAVQGDVAGGIESERQSVKDAQEKKGSLKYEIGGAFVPGVLAAPYTGGGQWFPLLLGLELLARQKVLYMAWELLRAMSKKGLYKV